MLLKVIDIVRNVLRGVWRPLYPLDARRRWWHYVEYGTHRLQGVLATLCVVLFPIGIGFVIYDRYAANPSGTVAFVALVGIIWLCLVALSYSRGRSMAERDAKAREAGKQGAE